MSGKSDISSHKLLLSLPAHVKRKPMSTSTNSNKQASQHHTKTRSKAGIVVTGTLPFGESIAEEMIVALSARASKNVGHYTQARESVAGCFGRGGNLCFGWAFGDMNAWLLAFGFVLASRFLSNELLLDFVGVEKTRLLAVGFVDFVLVRRGSDI